MTAKVRKGQRVAIMRKKQSIEDARAAAMAGVEWREETGVRGTVVKVRQRRANYALQTHTITVQLDGGSEEYEYEPWQVRRIP